MAGVGSEKWRMVSYELDFCTIFMRLKVLGCFLSSFTPWLVRS